MRVTGNFLIIGAGGKKAQTKKTHKIQNGHDVMSTYFPLPTVAMSSKSWSNRSTSWVVPSQASPSAAAR